jgi:hypothetical protein
MRIPPVYLLGDRVEIAWINNNFMKNATTLKAQATSIVNLNLHYGDSVG